MYTYPTENKMKAVTEASPRPVADVSTISMISRFLLKYWPTIKVAGSLVIATPMPEKTQKGLFNNYVNRILTIFDHLPIPSKQCCE